MKKQLVYVRYLAGFVLIMLLLWGVHRIAFRWAIQKSVDHLTDTWNVSISFGSYRSQGLSGAVFQKVCITYASGDTLFWGNDIKVRLKLLPLIIGKFQLAKLQIDSMVVNYRSHFLHRNDTTGYASDHHSEKLTINNRLRGLFRKLPATCLIGSATFRYIDSSQWFCARIDSFTIKDKRMQGILHLSDANATSTLECQGKLIPGQYHLAISIRNRQAGDNPLPFSGQKWNLMLSFSSAYLECQLPNATTLLFSVSARDLSLFHPKLSEQAVRFDTSGLSLLIKTEKDYWCIDSVSRLTFNGFTFPLFVRYDYDTVNPTLDFAIPHIEFPAQQLFDALPKGAFRHLTGLKAEGNLSFTLRGRIPFGMLDSLYLYSQLQPSGFRIKQFGPAYLPMLNDTFTVYRHEPGFPPVAIRVDSNAASYTRLRDIPKHLIDAVLTSEDGTFFYHRGFNEEAFAKSLAENIRKKRFARGASTISMQLVRNVFLSRNKNLSRKFEEVLLTWLLENSHIVTKERMLEIYFNIIEWGPNIYGIKQAARFYFNKKPSQLTLQESIFLAAIIPSPKYFRYTFVTNGSMKDGFEGYFQRVAQIMLARNQIQPSDTIGLSHRVTLSGAAAKMLISPQDSLLTNPSDTLFFDANEDF
jgi:hypothetical protein